MVYFMNVRKMRWSVLFLMVAGMTAFLASGALGETRVAVADFRNNAEGVNDAVRLAITDMLVTELGKTPGVSVLERSRLEAIAKEQRLAASGLVEESTAVQVGRLAGVQMIITGSITEFASTKSGGVIPLPIGGFGGLALGQEKAVVTLDVRTIDAETGRVVRTFRQRGEADRDMGGIVTSYGGFGQYEGGGILGSAAYDCVIKVVGQIRKDLQMMGLGSSHHVVDVKGKEAVIIDAGAMNANVNPNTLFEVYGQGEAILGIGGEVLGVDKYSYALLQCFDVKAQYSICRIVKGSSSNIQRGDMVEPFYGNAEAVKISSRALGEIGSSQPAPQPLGPQPIAPAPQPVGPAPVTVPAPQPQPQPVAPAPLPSAGGIANTSESMEVIDLYPIDMGLKNQIKIAHRGGYHSYANRQYSKAFQAFEQAYKLYQGNYLDAYWAARAAHKRGRITEMKKWLNITLSINPNYQPAIDYKAKYAK